MIFDNLEVAVVVQNQHGKTLLAHRPDEQRNPASLAKLMTAFIAVNLLNDDEVLTVEKSDLRTGSGNNLRPGDALSFRDALHNLLLPSSNTTARTIARVAGSRLTESARPIVAFIGAMNYEAARLGLTRTHFTNPHGLNQSGMLSTARDISTLPK